MTRTARLRAYAKLNLGLRVLFKRPDGYHEIRTVFQTISLADQIEVSFERANSTTVQLEGAPHIADNIADRAARLVLETLQIQGHVAIHLNKHIPSGAGLGGGSTDAAAMLLALPVLAGQVLAWDRAFAIAASLGSDVPFFLHGGTAVGLGRGEELYPMPERRLSRGLLIAPDIHSSTADAYRDLSLELTSMSLQNKLFSFQREAWQRGAAVGGNDFEAVVFARHPKLHQIKERLRRAGAKPAAMTGSGSAIFGFFDDPQKLDRARKSFRNERVFSISLLSRAQYRSSWMRALQPHIKGDQWPPQSLYAQ